MEKPRLSLKSVSIIIILALFVIGVLTFFSILGENHKINRTIEAYFNNVKDGMYLEACGGFSSNMQGEQLSSDEQRMNFNFLLELSLVKRYGLVDVFDYKVDLSRSNFWIPFISDNLVRVSVALRRKGDKSVFDTQSRGRGREFTRDLIVVGREKSSWKIRQFSIADSSLAETYNDLRQTIDLNKYVKRTLDGFRLEGTDIALKTLTPIDKRLLRFSLYKIQKSLGEDIIPMAKAKKKFF